MNVEKRNLGSIMYNDESRRLNEESEKFLTRERSLELLQTSKEYLNEMKVKEYNENLSKQSHQNIMSALDKGFTWDEIREGISNTKKKHEK